MDQTTVVKEQVEGGSKLLNQLLARGVDLVAACWAKTADYDRWLLYLVSPAVEGRDPRPVYLEIRTALREMETEWSQPFECVEPTTVQLIPPSDPLAQGLLTESPSALRKWSTLYGERMIGNTFVEGAYIYPSALFAKPASVTGS